MQKLKNEATLDFELDTKRLSTRSAEGQHFECHRYFYCRNWLTHMAWTRMLSDLKQRLTAGVQTESHFLLKCKPFSELRNAYFNQ